jgi:hypothetical protein
VSFWFVDSEHFLGPKVDDGGRSMAHAVDNSASLRGPMAVGMRPKAIYGIDTAAVKPWKCNSIGIASEIR